MSSSIAFNEDCMLTMPRFPDKCFDYVVADVQYGIGVGKMAYVKENKRQSPQKNGSRLSVRTKTVFELKEWDKDPPRNLILMK